jgi:CRP-like cAMP-binding protein
MQTVRARRIVSRTRELTSVVPVICEGWAAATVMLPDGSRQIISFLLPGDIISMTLLFEPAPSCFVEAITDVRCRIFNRSELRSLLFERPELLNRLCSAWVEEKSRADELIIDLGRRSADERVARLILNLADRLAAHGLVRGNPMEFDFPLRQYHIADATGLTSVHVSKVLSDFLRRGFISITNRSLAVLDPAGFRRVANIR